MVRYNFHTALHAISLARDQKTKVKQSKAFLRIVEMRDPNFTASKIQNPGPKNWMKPQSASIAGSANLLKNML